MTNKELLLEKYGVEMWSDETIVAFRKALLDWYDAKGRDHLPWRMNQDPYRIWVSEIMLQQTQVNTVIPYFNRFVMLFPSIRDLAEADEEVLLKAWEGLGYYSRVRNMQVAAQQVMTDYDGVFPSDPAEIIKLKGIGTYTCGAISSMAFGLPEPAVDGNVMRVFSRLFEIGDDIAKPATRKLFELLVRIVIDPDRPGDFNQAIMDLGSDICGPVNPRPEESPLREFNAAYKNGTMHLYPFKSKAKKPVVMDLHGVVVRRGNSYLMEKRPSGGLLGDFWTFPLVEEGPEDEPIGSFTHVFSHRKWHVQVHVQEADSKRELADNMKWVLEEDFPEYAFAVPQQKMWEIVKKHERKLF